VKICKSCQRETPHTNKLGLCSDCEFSHGEVWVLNIENGTWTRRKPTDPLTPQLT
jgi:hypothetical protein